MGREDFKAPPPGELSPQATERGAEPSPPEAPPQPQTVYVPIGWHYEYKSRATLFGLPLVHINFGRWGIHWAKGIIAVGNIATGALSVGCLSAGALALGALSAGIAALGGVAVGVLAVGGVAIGWLAIGGAAKGIYALGGAEIAKSAVQNAILQEFPSIPRWILRLFTSFCTA